MSAGEIVATGPARITEYDATPLDNPGKDIRLGLIVAALFFVVFLGWAALAPLDAAAFAPGQVTVQGQRQTVQHRDGGVVAALRVKEGQKVAAGQVLIDLSGAEVRESERALGDQMMSLMAQKARLEAEESGAAGIAWPAALFPDDPTLRAAGEAAMRQQTREFAEGRALLQTQSRVLGEQSVQSNESATGFGSQMRASAEQERLIDQELDALREVAAKGFVSQSRVRALERDKAAIQGQRAAYEASVAQAHSSSGEGRLKQLEAEKAYREKASADLRQVVFSLAEIEPKWRASRDQRSRLEIRAPVGGTVTGLAIHTVGGVIAPGEKLMDVVPDRAALVITAKFSVQDADDVTVGKEAQVRFTGVHDRGLPLLHGVVTRISADSFTDEKTGVSYYTGEVRVPESEIDQIRQFRGADFQLHPGMPAEVLVPLKKRTALQYAFEPLTESVWRSFREH
ncbi:MAG: HlyD family type I secretion periplasmic adaptor subunit [Sphingomicrobium sp.]|nr:HlyD family type I secretion periplasmic adaptor subunit [Sphingomonadales bacterium]